MAGASKTSRLLKRVGVTVLFYAQDGLCHICGNKVGINPQGDHGSIDHVWPTALRDEANPKQIGNILLAHTKCNGGKDARKPTGCELIFLFAVNRRLGLPEHLTQRWDQAA